MILRPPTSTRTDTLVPYTPLFPARRRARCRCRWARTSTDNRWRRTSRCTRDNSPATQVQTLPGVDGVRRTNAVPACYIAVILTGTNGDAVQRIAALHHHRTDRKSVE